MSEVAGNRPSTPPALCPYCGAVVPDGPACSACGGRFDPLSRQATQNQMGPWAVRDPKRAFQPGCSFAVLKRLVEQGKLRPDAVVRGPTTRQFWMLARRTPGLSRLFGVCHACGGSVVTDAYLCGACGAGQEPDLDRQHLGLGPIRPLPGDADPAKIAASWKPRAGRAGGGTGGGVGEGP